MGDDLGKVFADAAAAGIDHEELDRKMTQRLGLTASERSMRARIAAHTRWANEDPVKGTERARAAALLRFERQVDPDGSLDPQERARRATHARKAYFASLALKSAQARRRRQT